LIIKIFDITRSAVKSMQTAYRAQATKRSKYPHTAV
jgi:hypothetical protein